MIHYQMTFVSPTLKRTAWRVVRWTAMDTILGTVCGAFCGGMFGGFVMLFHFEPSQVVSIAGSFALCGAVSGALVGICSAVLIDVDAPVPESSSPRSAGLRNRIQVARQLVNSSSVRRLNHLVPASDTPLPWRESVESRMASLN
jgi:hypothetical protein